MVKRITGRKLRQRRAHILTVEPLCRACGVAPAEELDHIIELRHGGADDATNLQPLCKPCHLKKTLGHTPRRVIGLDGWPVQ